MLNGYREYRKAPLPQGDDADVVLAGQIAKLLKIDRTKVLYELRYGNDPRMRAWAKANRRRRRLTDEEKERQAREDAKRANETDGPWKYELRGQSASNREVTMYDTDDPMAALNRKRDEIRKRNPHLTLEQAFTKAYHENPALAQQERRESMERLGVGYPITRDDRPAQVGGAELDDVTGGNDAGALTQLTELAEEEHVRTGKPFAQCFADVYERHKDLARAERRHAYAKLLRAA